MPEAARRDMLEKAAAALPVRRVGVGDDIAQQILMFMANGFATGSVVYIDGGARWSFNRFLALPKACASDLRF